MIRRHSRIIAFITLYNVTLVSGGALAEDTPALNPSVQAAPADVCDTSAFKIAIDIGHYRAKPGAISATGVPEFVYNLSLAQLGVSELRQSGFTNISLIGESGSPLSLTDRTTIAKDYGADLFISLHHDSVQPQYLSKWEFNGKPERYSDNFNGYSLFISTKNSHSQESRQFAVLLGEALLREGLQPSLHHAEHVPGENRPLLDARLGLYRYDDLIVLKTAAMPSVLVESGIIANRAEEQQIRNGNHDELVAKALVKAVRGFCALHPAKR